MMKQHPEIVADPGEKVKHREKNLEGTFYIPKGRDQRKETSRLRQRHRSQVANWEGNKNRGNPKEKR